MGHPTGGLARFLGSPQAIGRHGSQAQRPANWTLPGVLLEAVLTSRVLRLKTPSRASMQPPEGAKTLVVCFPGDGRVSPGDGIR